MLKIHQYAIMCAPTTSQLAAVEALRNGDEDIASMTEEYNRRRRYIYNGLRSIGIESFEPEGRSISTPTSVGSVCAPIPSASACSMRTAVPSSPAPPSETAARASPVSPTPTPSNTSPRRWNASRRSCVNCKKPPGSSQKSFPVVFRFSVRSPSPPSTPEPVR